MLNTNIHNTSRNNVSKTVLMIEARVENLFLCYLIHFEHIDQAKFRLLKI